MAEPSRRKAGATGLPVALADGEPTGSWPSPTIGRAGPSLTVPDVDAELDRLFESAAVGAEVELADVWSVARTLLLENYDLTDEEFADAGRTRASARRAVPSRRPSSRHSSAPPTCGPFLLRLGPRQPAGQRDHPRLESVRATLPISWLDPGGDEADDPRFAVHRRQPRGRGAGRPGGPHLMSITTHAQAVEA